MDLRSFNFVTININNISNQTKLDALASFVRIYDIDIFFLQEVENDMIDIPGYTILFNIDIRKRGVAIGFKSSVEHVAVEKSLDGRLIVVRLKNGTTLCNIYAPTGSQNHQSRENFFNCTCAHYLRNLSGPLILGGDFNSIVNNRDATGATPKSDMTSRLMTSLDLFDVWRELHRNQTNFTFVRGGSGSRLDRFLISKSAREHIRTIQHVVTCFSDHKAVILRMVMPVTGTNIGRGIWRLNTVTMDDEETMAELQRKWDYLVRQRRNFTSWLTWWIDFVKPKLAAFFRWRTSIQNREYRDTMELLYGELARRYDLYVDDASQLTRINHIKSLMLRMQREKSNKSRMLYDTYLQGEPTSTFHLAEKSKNRKSTHIHQLEFDGRIIQGPEVVQHAVNYFENLFSDNTVDLQSPDFVPTCNIPQNNERNETILDPLSEEEIRNCIKQSCSRKSPGEDGLPKEFYSKAWDIIKQEFTMVMNEALQTPDINSKFMNGIVVLVKKKGTGNDMKAYRPITLLNFDYKVLTRIIKQRITPLVEIVLSRHQKCSNGKRNIFEATTKILDKISELKFGGQSSMLVSFDMDHAFDRVKHSFLFRVLEQMNFNPRLIEFLRKITRNSYSRILVNGILSRPFQIL